MLCLKNALFWFIICNILFAKYRFFCMHLELNCWQHLLWINHYLINADKYRPVENWVFRQMERAAQTTRGITGTYIFTSSRLLSPYVYYLSLKNYKTLSHCVFLAVRYPVKWTKESKNYIEYFSLLMEYENERLSIVVHFI